MMYDMMLPRKERLRITARSAVDDRSIRRVYAGEPVWPLTRRRVEEAARALGLPPPGPDLAARSAKMEAHAARVREERERVRALVPEVSDHDLLLILDRLLRPIEEQRFFIRRVAGHYVF
jgi:hypothetical protein